MNKRFSPVLLALSAASLAFAGDSDRAMMGALMRMELAGQVVAEAGKLSDLPDVAEAAELMRDQMYGRAKDLLLEEFESMDEAQEAFVAFIEDVRANPADYAGIRAEVAAGGFETEVDCAGRFLGGVQSWLRLREKGDVPPLQAWLDRDVDEEGGEAVAENPRPKKKKKRKTGNPLRDSEAAPGEFVEQEEEAGALDTFRAARDERRRKAIQEAESGMAQVAEERRVADEEYNAKKQARATAEAAAMQAQAQKLAAADQEAVQQDQNSWKTRLKGIASSAIGATGGALLGSVGTRVGQEAANALFNIKTQPQPPPR